MNEKNVCKEEVAFFYYISLFSPIKFYYTAIFNSAFFYASYFYTVVLKTSRKTHYNCNCAKLFVIVWRINIALSLKL